LGDIPVPETIDSHQAVLELLVGLVEAVIGPEGFLVVGHSYGGGDLARAIATGRPGRVPGLALVCPIGGQGRQPDPDPGRPPGRHRWRRGVLAAAGA
jgi:pimeloyl-ACP methyl ester carboxylesterase